jgi:hypothetical protein
LRRSYTEKASRRSWLRLKAKDIWLLRTHWSIPTIEINRAEANPARWPGGTFSGQGAAATLGITPRAVFLIIWNVGFGGAS